MDERLRSPAPTIRHALGVIAETTIDQARDVAVALLDHWVERVCQRLAVPAASAQASAESAMQPSDQEPAPVATSTATPVLVGVAAGVLLGATGTWLFAGHPSKT